MSLESALESYGISGPEIIRNPSPAHLYELALRTEPGTRLTRRGALVALSGEKTGRSPTDKRIVDEPDSTEDVWWGPVNVKLEPHSFVINRERAADWLATRERLFVIDAYAGWDPKYQIKVRVVCARAYHALFMHNMLIRPTAEQLEDFGEPDYVILNAGQFPANRHTAGMSSKTSVDLSLANRELVILGTQYAGEMKKGIFTVMHYLMPKIGVLSMHCSATTSDSGDTSVLFGLSGTGKTTLSADPKRTLIGDDEHCWSDDGVFNIEGGCYAKMIDLAPESEPDIFQCLRFGAVLENVVLNQDRTVDYHDTSITQNTRGSYPIEYMEQARTPCVGGHPNNVIFLTCDAFGVLPPVSKLTPEQAMYHFISGYTAKVAGTEMGITDPVATFSPCFGGPFLVWHPAKYAELLAEKTRTHGANVWLVNTGWSGGPHGVGDRMKLSITRAIIDAIHDGTLAQAHFSHEPFFGLAIPHAVNSVPSHVLDPKKTWSDPAAYDAKAEKLAGLFIDNFRTYESGASEAVVQAGPRQDG
jgi:phosphoenolpyruvate carboxykinase (ATP)